MQTSHNYLNNVLGGILVPIRTSIKHMSLMQMLIKREIVTRTSGTVLGILWPLLQPAMQVLGFWFLFDVVYGMRQNRGPSYLEFLLTGMLPWMCLSEVLNRAAGMFREFSSLYHRAPFPIEMLPVFIMIIPALVYALVYGLLCFYMFGFIAAAKSLLVLPLLLLWLLPFTLLFSVLGVFMRDFTQVLPFLLMLALYCTPILYFPDMLPTQAQSWLWLNPFADVMTCIHALVQGSTIDAATGLRLLLVWLVLLVPSWHIFRRSLPHIREVL